MPYDPTKPYKKRIQEAVQKTWKTPYAMAQQFPGWPYPVVMEGLSKPFGVVDHTDGIGTKGVLHWQHRSFGAAVQDAMAMNLNDLLVVRARPFKMQNHLTLVGDDHDAILAVITHLAHECKMRDIILTGGETSIHNTMQGMDLSLTVSGFVVHDPTNWPANEFRAGDVLIGLPSTGLHSNGFTFVREHFGTLWSRRELTTPTRIYWDKSFPVVTDPKYDKDVHCMVHIAGGGFTRLLDYTAGLTLRVKRWQARNSIFEEIYRLRQDERFMYTRFNCGMGFVLSVDPTKADELVTLLDGEIIGEVVYGGESRMVIESIFSQRTLDFE